jgi:hypothetical protein
MPTMGSPYEGLPVETWANRTKELILEHPLGCEEICSVVYGSWDDILQSRIGKKPFRIGVDMFPRPQIMAYFLHELIALEFAHRYPTTWRREETTDEKDLVYVPDSRFSIEIKTSSSSSGIFGNRSYTQESNRSKKSKSGYHLAINFEKFGSTRHGISMIRFGWLDLSDWIGQIAASGQQARLEPNAARHKLLRLPLD